MWKHVWSFIDTSVKSKILNELNLIISRRFNDPNCWDVIEVLMVLKEELIAREKLFFSEPNADLFTASPLRKTKKKADILFSFCNKSSGSFSYLAHFSNLNVKLKKNYTRKIFFIFSEKRVYPKKFSHPKMELDFLSKIG